MRSRSKRQMTMLASASAWGLVSASLQAPASAQDAAELPAQQANSVTDETQAPDIIVTAQKRAEPLSRVPLSVSVLGNEQLDRLNATDFGDYARSVPSLSFQDLGPTGNRGQRSAALRGIFSPADPTISETIGFYIDDTPIPLIDPGILDVERIEVLRGPQGTLYGASAMGGLIKIVTRRADPSAAAPSGQGRGEVSFTKDGGTNYRTGGNINAPIVRDKLAISLSANATIDAGYVDNVNASTPFSDPLGLLQTFAPPRSLNVRAEKNANSSRIYDARAEVRFTPTETISIAPSVLYHRAKENSSSAYNEAIGRYKSNYEAPSHSRESYYLASLPITVDLGAVTLSSSTSYFRSRNIDVEDTTEGNRLFSIVSEGSAQTNRRRREITTQEVRLSSDDTDETISWLVGLFYQKGELDAEIEERAVNPLYIYSGFPIPLGSLFASGRASPDFEEIAAFASTEIRPSPGTTITLGIRPSHVKTRTSTQSTGGLFTPTGAETVTRSKDDNITYRLSLSQEISHNNLVYGTISTGYRRSGSNVILKQQCTDLGAQETFKSDKLINYELGAKLSDDGQRIRLNTSAYYIDWKNIQQSVFLGPPCGNAFFVNAGDASVKGVELELTASPIRNFTFGFSGSYTDARFKDDNLSIGVRRGDRIPLVSELQISAFADANVPINDSAAFYLRGNVQYQSGATFTLPGLSQNFFKQPVNNTKDPYTTFGASIGVMTKTGWDLRLFGTNLLNEAPAIGQRLFGPNNRRVLTLQPRTVGIRLSKDF